MSDRESFIIRLGNNLQTWSLVLGTIGGMIVGSFFAGRAWGSNQNILELPGRLDVLQAALENRMSSSDAKNAQNFKELNQAIESIKDRLKTLEFNVTGPNGIMERFGQLSGRVDANIEGDISQSQRIREVEIMLQQLLARTNNPKKL